MRFKKLLLALTASLILGQNIAYGWTLNMDFNKGQLGTNIYDRGNGYPVFSDAAGWTTYSDCGGVAISGHCAKMRTTKGFDGFGKWGGRIKFTDMGVTNPKKGDEIWISYKIYFPLDFDYTASPHFKFIRLHTTGGYDDLYITPDGYTHWDKITNKNSNAPFFFIYEGQNWKRLFGNFDTDRPKKGQWETYEVYMKLDNVTTDNGGTAKVRIWKNGKLLADLNDVQTLKSSGGYADAFLMFTYWNGGNASGTGSYPSKDQYLYVDDLKITTDTPTGRDVYGNPMIGDVLNKPKPPTSIQLN